MEWIVNYFADPPLAIACAAAVLLASGAMTVRARRNRAPEALRAAATTHPRPADPADVPFSPEERKVGRLILAAMALLAVFCVSPVVLFIAAHRLQQPAWQTAAWVSAICVALFLIFIFKGRWPGQVRKQSGVDIAAPRAAVWSAMRFRETSNWWSPAVRRIDRVPGAGEIYRMRYYNLQPCLRCGLPHPPESPGSVLEVEVLEETVGERLVIRTKDVEGPGCAKPTVLSELSTYLLTDLPDGGTRLRLLSLAERPRAWFALLILAGDPPGEHLRTLQGHIEGKDYQTLSDTAAQRIEAARRAASYCACAPAD